LTIDTILEFLGISLAVAIPLGGVWLRRRQWAKHELWYDLSVTKLKQDAGPAHQIQLLVGDELVSDPYSVKLQVWSTGRSDIPSAIFDGGEPIRFGMNVPIIGEVSFQLGQDDSRVAPDHDTSAVILRPGLIRSDFKMTAEFLTDGRPEPKTIHALQNAKVRSVREERASSNDGALIGGIGRILLFVSMIILLSLIGVGMFVSPVQSWAREWTGLFILSIFVGLTLTNVGSNVRGRWQRALIKGGLGRNRAYVPGDPFIPRSESK
jgi:hypothetical protein